MDWIRREKTNLQKTAIVSLLILTSIVSNAQISEESDPYSCKLPQPKSLVSVPTSSLKIDNVEKLIAEDKEFPSPFRYSLFEDIEIDIKKEGLNTKLDEQNGMIWRYKIETENAKSIQLFFSKYHIPEEAKLFIYNDDYSETAGAFTSFNNNEANSLMISDFPGNSLIIEYFEPDDKAFEGELILGSVGQAYKNIFSSLSSLDEDGYIGINCPEGMPWQNQKHSVCLITFEVGGSGYVCSGALINNTENDGIPYMLTANHCIDNDYSAGTAVAYFNYEQRGCNGGTINYNQTISGATLASTGTSSDYSLLRFNNTPPSAYQPYYSGWDISGIPGDSSTGIHHPESRPKKISLDFSPPVSYDEPITWEDETVTPANSHWEVGFDIGRTYEGSSGSPLFDNNHRIIGQLHGNYDNVNYYGKINYSWTHTNPTFSTMKSFLDPDNSGITNIDGYYPANNNPDPQFYSEFTTVCTDAPVQFSGFSAFDPTSWEWTFTPTSVTFLDGTDETWQNPVIEFNSESVYQVELTVTNSAGSKSLIKNNMIEAGNNLEIEVLPYANEDSCVCSFDSVMLSAGGAISYIWSLDNELTGRFYLVNDTVNPVVIKSYDTVSLQNSEDITLKITGTHGTCSDTSTYTFPLLAQSNDHIENAIVISEGINGIFSNKCATVQANEPEPAHTSCTGQYSWCDEYGTGEDIVENSVWFYFVPTEDDELEFVSEGFDNQIAVYLADSYEDILAGNYTIVGANDDHTFFDFNAYIEEIEVTAGETYWIQVDGSAGGTEGEFYLTIDQSKITGEKEITSNLSLNVYPVPAEDHIILESDYFNNAETIDISVYNSSGIEVISETHHHPGDAVIEMDVSGLEKGLYILRLICDNTLLNTRIVK